MRRGLSISVLTVALAILSVIPSPAQANTQLPGGTWIRDSAAGDDLEHVVSGALPKVKSALARIFKGKAKSRLRQVITAPAWQRFTQVADSLTLETDAFPGDRALTVVPGMERTWTRIWPGGKAERLTVRTSHSDNGITYRYIAEDGQRSDAYSIDANGTLTQRVTLESSQLKAPISYTLVYRRK